MLLVVWWSKCTKTERLRATKIAFRGAVAQILNTLASFGETLGITCPFPPSRWRPIVTSPAMILSSDSGFMRHGHVEKRAIVNEPLLRLRVLLGTDVVLFHAPIQGVAAYVEGFGGGGDIPVTAAQFAQ